MSIFWPFSWYLIVVSSLLTQRSVQTLLRTDYPPRLHRVCITSYGVCLIREFTFKFSFEYIIVNEVHCIKDIYSVLYQIVLVFISCGWLVITCALLQHNLEELFALLNLICLEIFMDYTDLDSSCVRMRPAQRGERRVRKWLRHYTRS